MRLLENRSDLRRKKILVMGLGTKDGGLGMAVLANRYASKVTITDLESKAKLAQSLKKLGDMPVDLRLGGHHFPDFETADVVVRNPGIKRDNPYLRVAEQCGAIVESPIGIFAKLALSPWLGITGTKGKSYTTALVAHILNSANRQAVAAGNNCVSPLRYVDEKDVFAVLELSSWQLRELDHHRISPRIGCWLNFFSDHMNWYASLNEYKRDKEAIFRHQCETDFAIVPQDDAMLSQIECKSNRLFFSSSEQRDGLPGVFVEAGDLVWKNRGETKRITEIATLGGRFEAKVHFDAVPPAVCTAIAAGVKPTEIGPALRTFEGLPHRFQTLYDRDGLRIVNDSAATTPESVALALTSVGEGYLVLIAGGGGHKNLNYEWFAERIDSRVDRLITFRDDPASKKLINALGVRHYNKICLVDQMNEAVDEGLFALKNKNGTLLLSPGSSGSPAYVDLFERGDIFAECVDGCVGSGL